MAVGAVCGYIGAVSTGSPWLGLLAGAFAGACAAGVHAIFAGLGADQVVSGLALTILGLGMANFIGDSYTDDTRRSQFADVDIPVLRTSPGSVKPCSRQHRSPISPLRWGSEPGSS